MGGSTARLESRPYGVTASCVGAAWNREESPRQLTVTTSRRWDRTLNFISILIIAGHCVEGVTRSRRRKQYEQVQTSNSPRESPCNSQNDLARSM
jgi:hypothetical protein